MSINIDLSQHSHYDNTRLHIANNGVVYFSFRLFDEKGIKNGFSTRLGGVSDGIFKSMNLSFQRGDQYENVLENHRLFAEAVGYNHMNSVFSDQIHETSIAHVTAADRGHGMKGEKGIPNMDGLITDEPNVPILTFYADCVPLMFYDPVKKVIAAAHSGWKGTVAGIGRVMVDTLVRDNHCRREDILAVIGPSICWDCYEVSEDVVEAFKSEFPSRLYDKIFIDKDNGKYQLNLWAANEYVLRDAGIAQEHLTLPDICTCHNDELMISHRATGGKRGNMAAVLMLDD